MDKKQKLKELLEKEGCMSVITKETNIKNKIMKITENCKKSKLPNIHDLNIIYNNLEKLDHFDCVRVDQIITIMYNMKETEYQWASVCMHKKWKTL